VEEIIIDGMEKNVSIAIDDDNLFNAYYNEPVFTEEQKQRYLDNINNFESWLYNIITK